MHKLVPDQVREGVIALRKPSNTVYHPMTLHEFRCLKHNIFLHKKEDGVSITIRNDGRNIHGESVQMAQVDLTKSDVRVLIEELQALIF